MFKLKGIKLGAAFLLLSGTVGANVMIDNQLIPTEDIVSINITPGTNTLIINTTEPYIIERANSGPVTPTNDVVIDRFTASPSTLVEGGFTTLSWQTQNADFCTPTGGTPTWRSTSIALDSNGNGSTNIQIDTPSSYTFGMYCTDINNQDSPPRQAIVNVTAQSNPQTPANCDAPSLTGGIENWSAVWGAVFPGPNGLSNERIVSVARYGYKALKFNTANATGYGAVIPLVPTSTGGVLKVSISECPGDFAVTAPNCQPTFSVGEGVNWSTTGMFRTCDLELNKDYYLNLTYTNGVTASPGCTGACEIKLQYNKY